MKRTFTYVILGLMSFLLFSGCGGGNGGTSPPLADTPAILASDAVQLSPDTSNIIASFTNYSSSIPGQQQFTFNGSSPQLETLKAGSPIIMGITPSTPTGFMGKVSSIAKDTSGNTVVTTEPAALNEVFKDLKINYSKTISAGDITVDSPYKVSSMKNTLKNALAVVTGSPEFTQSFDLSYGNFIHKVDVTLKSDIRVDVDIASFSVSKINISASPYYKVVDTFGGDGKVPFLNINREIGRFRSSPIPIPGTPLFITPIITLRLNASGEIEGKVTFTKTREAQYSTELNYQNDTWSNSFNKIVDNISYDREFGVKATVEATVTPQLDILFNGVAGPYVNFELTGKVTVDPCADPWFKVESGADMNMGVKIRLINKSAEFLKVELLPFGLVEQINGQIPYKGIVTGVVTDYATSQLLSGVDIKFTTVYGKIAGQTTTDSFGMYSLSLPACTYTAGYTITNYLAQSQSVSDIAYNKTVQHDVALGGHIDHIKVTTQGNRTVIAIGGTLQLTAKAYADADEKVEVPTLATDYDWQPGISYANIDANGLLKLNLLPLPSFPFSPYATYKQQSDLHANISISVGAIATLSITPPDGVGLGLIDSSETSYHFIENFSPSNFIFSLGGPWGMINIDSLGDQVNLAFSAGYLYCSNYDSVKRLFIPPILNFTKSSAVSGGIISGDITAPNFACRGVNSPDVFEHGSLKLYFEYMVP